TAAPPTARRSPAPATPRSSTTRASAPPSAGASTSSTSRPSTSPGSPPPLATTARPPTSSTGACSPPTARPSSMLPARRGT
ncbi:hypothetical protein KEM52_003096, partial [Ascosphaera acerosa]